MCWSFRLGLHYQSALFVFSIPHSATDDFCQICRFSQEAVNLSQRSVACEIIRKEGASFVQEEVTKAHFELWHWSFESPVARLICSLYRTDQTKYAGIAANHHPCH
jgi:hypothetical protein